LEWGCPFLADVLIGQINQFQQSHVRRERAFGFGHLAYLAMKALDRIGRVDEPADGRVVLKVGAQLGPVVAP